VPVDPIEYAWDWDGGLKAHGGLPGVALALQVRPV